MASTSVRGQLIFQDENALLAHGKSNVFFIHFPLFFMFSLGLFQVISFLFA